MNINEVKTIILSGTVEIEEQMVDRKNMIYGYYLKVDRDKNMGKVLNKCFTTGYNRCIGLRIDSESIMGYVYEFVTEKLMEIDIDEWNNMTWKQRERLLVLYCDDNFRALSKCEGTNYNREYVYDNEEKKYKFKIHNNTSYEIMMEQGLESELDEQIREKRSGDLTKYIFETYINEDYLIPSQVKFVNDCLNNYTDIHGNIVDIVTGEILYSVKNASNIRTRIRNRLEKLIDKDIHLDNIGRFIYKR